eukprot:544547-Prorocentrum_minimum.AAC.1
MEELRLAGGCGAVIGLWLWYIPIKGLQLAGGCGIYLPVVDVRGLGAQLEGRVERSQCLGETLQAQQRLQRGTLSERCDDCVTPAGGAL